MLNSSSVMTDSAGVVAQTLDYYPFGEIRLDTHPSTSSGSSTFNEQRKFIGQEFDAETGLNYLNARYYNSVIGRFISQDPVSLATPEKLLTDPQQLNFYSYARNNPIIGSDPDGLAVVTVGGTNFGGGGTELKNETLINNISNSFPDQKILSFNWDGADNTNNRTEGANQLNSFIKDQFQSLPDNEPLNIVCHSHGCNTVSAYTNISDSKQVNNLISLGGPVLKDNPINSGKVNNHINVYSNDDLVQKLGGNQINLSSVVGYIFGGTSGLIKGSQLGWGEFGLAGRKVDGANNVNVSKETKWWHPAKSHSDLLTNQNIWDSVNKAIK